MIQIATLFLAQAAPPIIAVGDRIARPALVAPQMHVENLSIRVSSPEGVLWQGTVRVSPNQGASYHQNLSEASPNICPAGSSYDQSDRRHINFNVYSQSGQSGQAYRIDASWGRPIRDAACGAGGTRTVQVNQTVRLDPGETAVVEGDAGLRIEITRGR